MNHLAFNFAICTIVLVTSASFQVWSTHDEWATGHVAIWTTANIITDIYVGHHLFLTAGLLLTNTAATVDDLKMILCNVCSLIRFGPVWDIFGSSSTRGNRQWVQTPHRAQEWTWKALLDGIMQFDLGVRSLVTGLLHGIITHCLPPCISKLLCNPQPVSLVQMASIIASPSLSPPPLSSSPASLETTCFQLPIKTQQDLPLM